MEGGRVSHSWWMCVVSHCYGGFGVGRDDGDGWYACGTKPGGSNILRYVVFKRQCMSSIFHATLSYAKTIVVLSNV